MNKNQEYTPKYFVVHERESTDVLIRTMSKSLQGAIDKYDELYGVDCGFYFEANVVASLIELKEVTL